MVEPVAVVFAGGQGTRLWPLSRADAPKQFQALANDISLTTATIDRLRQVLPPDRIFVSTSVEFVAAATKCLGDVPADNLIVERGGKGPATALALSLATVRHRFGDAPLFTCPSDHLIEDGEAFVQAIAEMFAQVEKTPEAVVLLGAVPTHPDPTLGYMRAHLKEGDSVYEVLQQIEKPDRALAAELIAEGSVFWNTMCYALDSKHALDVYRRRRPDVTAAVEEYIDSGSNQGYDGPAAQGLELEPFFEDGMKPLLVTRELGWNDIGTWPRLESYLNARDVSGLGPSVSVDSSDIVVASLDGRPVVVLGVKDLVIVTHEDAVYVLDKEKAGDVVVLEQLRAMLGEDRKDLL